MKSTGALLAGQAASKGFSIHGKPAGGGRGGRLYQNIVSTGYKELSDADHRLLLH